MTYTGEAMTLFSCGMGNCSPPLLNQLKPLILIGNPPFLRKRGSASIASYWPSEEEYRKVKSMVVLVFILSLDFEQPPFSLPHPLVVSLACRQKPFALNALSSGGGGEQLQP